MNATKQPPVKNAPDSGTTKTLKTVVGAAHFVIDCNPIQWGKEMVKAITDTCFGAIAIDRETLEGGVVDRLSGDLAKRNEEVEQKYLRRLGRRVTLYQQEGRHWTVARNLMKGESK